MVGIYKITNLINSHIYIGKTNNSDRRWKDHKRLAFTKDQKEYDKTLYQAMRKYGIDNFSFEIIEEIPIEKYNLISGDREQYWINYYDSYNKGYNENQGGDGGSKKGHCQGSQNGRAKLTEDDVKTIRSNYAKGMSKGQCYELFKDKITESGFARVWLGKTWSYIMPEVFTKENKERNTKLGKGNGAKRHRKLSNEEVRMIREMHSKGRTCSEILETLNYKVKGSTIQDVIHHRTYKEVI